MIRHIPIRPHVKQFMLRTHGAEPIAVHQNSEMGRLVRLCLHKEPFRQVRPRPAAAPRCSVQIQMPAAFRHHAISEEKLRELGEYFEQMFRSSFLHYMLGCTLAGVSEWGAVRRFYDAYQISPEDYDMDALRKVWRDHKDRIRRHNESWSEANESWAEANESWAEAA